MKNIYVLPTDKPSRLWINNLLQGKLELSKEVLPYNTSHNIYITSDEEIKEGIYTIDLRFNTIVKITTLNIEDCKIGFYDGSLKKIILTTDQDLIADGIQAIDDNFIEWFAKNPSCEEIKFEVVNDNIEWYKIIIPKEEPKQELERGITITHVGKQETLEEAEEFKYYFENDIVMLECINKMASTGKVPKKWSWFLAKISELYKQQERMYSEEDIRKAIQETITLMRYKATEFREHENTILKQFKKK